MTWLITLIKNLFMKKETITEVEYIPVSLTPPDPQPEIPAKTPRDALYETAKVCIGIDVSPKDIAPDELGCAESVWNILNRAFPNNVGFPLTVSTIVLFRELSKSPLYKRVETPLAGDIIISVTGTGNGRIKHGHTGIVGKYQVMSNDSNTGKWAANYTLRAWKNYFENLGGMKVYYFRRCA